MLTVELNERIEEKLRASITERILREAGFEDQIAAGIAAIEMPTADALTEGIRQMFEREPDREWRDHQGRDRRAATPFQPGRISLAAIVSAVARNTVSLGDQHAPARAALENG